MTSKRRVSPLWNHFDEVTVNKRAKCRYCLRILAITASSIGTLRRHLRCVHPTIEAKCPRKPKTDGNTDEELDFPSASANLADVKPKRKRPPKKSPVIQVAVVANFVTTDQVQQLDDQFVKMIAKGYHTLRIADEVEFRKFVELLNPGYTLPTRKTLSESLLPKVYHKVLESAENLVAKAAAICITTDAWTSIANDGYIAITAHFINTDTHKLCAVMIGCVEFEEKLTSENLKLFLEQKFNEWHIHHRVNAIVTDNSANVLRAVRSGGWRSITCFAHTINLVVQASMPEISEIVNKVRAVVEYFNRSPDIEQVREQMNISHLKLKRDDTTRWNSTYNMLISFLRGKDDLITTLALMQPDLSLSEDDWLTIEKATELLKIFDEITFELCSENYVSASKYIVFCKIINRMLSKYSSNNIEQIERLRISLQSQMYIKFRDIESNVLLSEATILDPRFKKTGFNNVESFSRASSAIKSRIAAQKETGQNTSARRRQSAWSGESSYVWEEFETELATRDPQNATAAGHNEFDEYMAEPMIKRTENPLAWWDGRKAMYPRLYKYMLKRLNIAATSVSCERIFSKAGLTLNERRTRLTAIELPQLLFISSNCDLTESA